MKRGSQHSEGDASGKTYCWRITVGEEVEAGVVAEGSDSTTKGLAAVVPYHRCLASVMVAVGENHDPLMET